MHNLHLDITVVSRTTTNVIYFVLKDYYRSRHIWVYIYIWSLDIGNKHRTEDFISNDDFVRVEINMQIDIIT